jgi:hypothetical protein
MGPGLSSVQQPEGLDHRAKGPDGLAVDPGSCREDCSRPRRRERPSRLTKTTHGELHNQKTEKGGSFAETLWRQGTVAEWRCHGMPGNLP